MHWYQRNIGDYYKKASRLTMEQHGAYTLLQDACYDRERFPTREEAYSWCWASSQGERDAIDFVLDRFFTEDEDGRFIQSRIVEELQKFEEKCARNKRIAEEREAKRRAAREAREHEASTSRARVVHEAPPEEHEAPPTQYPVPNTQYPVPNIKPKDIAPSSDELEAVDSDGDPVVAKLPTNRINTIGEKFPITQTMLDDWIETYPGVDVRQELRAMYGWLMANQAKRKTLTGMAKFINAWLAREQNRGGSNGKNTDNGPGGTGRPTDTRRLSGAERTRLAREQARSREASAR